jgi:hypothetical protein
VAIVEQLAAQISIQNIKNPKMPKVEIVNCASRSRGGDKRNCPGRTDAPLLLLACEETMKVGFVRRPSPRPSRCKCLCTWSLPGCADSTVALFRRFFFRTPPFLTLTKPGGQPLRTEEPAKPARSNQPARATKRRSPIICPPRLAQTELAAELPMSARTIPANGEAHS